MDGEMNSVLSEVVKRGSLALQAEDCLVRAAVHHRGEHGGILRLQNERYYQFIIWRAILPVWHADVERSDTTDLVVAQDQVKHHFEMKTYFTEQGKTEIPGMQRDVRKLSSRQEPGYLLVISANPPKYTGQYIDDLARMVGGLSPAAAEVCKFPTKNSKNEDLDFWLAGWPVDRGDHPPVLAS